MLSGNGGGEVTRRRLVLPALSSSTGREPSRRSSEGFLAGVTLDLEDIGPSFNLPTKAQSHWYGVDFLDGSGSDGVCLSFVTTTTRGLLFFCARYGTCRWALRCLVPPPPQKKKMTAAPPKEGRPDPSRHSGGNSRVGKTCPKYGLVPFRGGAHGSSL